VSITTGTNSTGTEWDYIHGAASRTTWSRTYFQGQTRLFLLDCAEFPQAWWKMDLQWPLILQGNLTWPRWGSTNVADFVSLGPISSKDFEFPWVLIPVSKLETDLIAKFTSSGECGETPIAVVKLPRQFNEVPRKATPSMGANWSMKVGRTDTIVRNFNTIDLSGSESGNFLATIPVHLDAMVAWERVAGSG